ncbi:MAG: hypothetical protein HYT83_03650 [Candidatus Levybacteria bacterium]|nr:hypothetical protein [Candidatus Levybacteria bacterium]
MSRTILQVPMSPTLRKEAEKQALAQGFSSLQEAVRVFLQKLAKGALGITFEEEKAVQLSPKAIKRYDKIIDDIDSGKAKLKTFENVSDLMKYLNK